MLCVLMRVLFLAETGLAKRYSTAGRFLENRIVIVESSFAAAGGAKMPKKTAVNATSDILVAMTRSFLADRCKLAEQPLKTT